MDRRSIYTLFCWCSALLFAPRGAAPRASIQQQLCSSSCAPCGAARDPEDAARRADPEDAARRYDPENAARRRYDPEDAARRRCYDPEDAARHRYDPEGGTGASRRSDSSGTSGAPSGGGVAVSEAADVGVVVRTLRQLGDRAAFRRADAEAEAAADAEDDAEGTADGERWAVH